MAEWSNNGDPDDYPPRWYAKPVASGRLAAFRRKRPIDGRAAEQRDELAAFQLIEWHPIHASQCGIAGYRTGGE
jgi:hypothetical protein